MSESSDWAVVFHLTPLCEQTASVVQWNDTHLDTDPFLGDIVKVTIVFGTASEVKKSVLRG